MFTWFKISEGLADANSPVQNGWTTARSCSAALEAQRTWGDCVCAPESLCNALGPDTSVNRLYFSKKTTKAPEGPRRSAGGGPPSPPPFLCPSAWLPFPAVPVLSGSCTYVCLNSCVYTCTQYIRTGIDGCTFKYMRARVCVCYFPLFMQRVASIDAVLHVGFSLKSILEFSVCE